jgi:hypothetical protein
MGKTYMGNGIAYRGEKHIIRAEGSQPAQDLVCDPACLLEAGGAKALQATITREPGGIDTVAALTPPSHLTIM